MKGFFAGFFALLVMADIVLGATIHGNIYDFSLNRIGNVVVEINTAPKQFYVSKNGTYSFTVPVGFYEVKAQHYDRGLLVSSTAENITVRDSGDYILDLVLFPIINEEELLEGEIKAAPDYKGNFVVLVAVVVAMLAAVYFYHKRKKEPERVGEKSEGEKGTIEPVAHGNDFPEKVLSIVKEEGGRTTQKEIRKRVPLSEAKISLIIAELEASGKIRKIKKGRGNIIILNK
jgi:uncharacterized membrane protein